jgi:DNA-binding FadR family transcriptional regulator
MTGHPPQADDIRYSQTGKGVPARGAAADGLFTAVNLGRASQAIVEQIRILLREQRLRPGDRLPSERELCNQFAVSRVTVREALRILEASGLITVKVGARGGAFVTSPTSGQVGAGLADLVSLSPLTAVEVTEARIVLELGIVPLVVERATDEDIEDLRAMTNYHSEMLKLGGYTMEMSAAFHTRVAACTHNNAIESFVRSIHGPLLMSLMEAKTVAPLMGHTGCGEHMDFIEAVAKRDVAAAMTIMKGHLRRTADRLAARSSSEAAS